MKLVLLRKIMLRRSKGRQLTVTRPLNFRPLNFALGVAERSAGRVTRFAVDEPALDMLAGSPKPS